MFKKNESLHLLRHIPETVPAHSYLHYMLISPAAKKDIPLLVALINSAYRGEASKKGWTTEADLIKGELRTDGVTIKKLMETKEAVFLKYVTENNKIGGCVFLQKKNDKLYLGMLSVSPDHQAKGIGGQLMNAAYIHAQQSGCNCIFMKVISLRQELINWYEKQGYFKTGETEPFPADNRFGTPTQPLEFVIMEKMIS